MKAFLVEYDGLWRGGVSIVVAENEEQALALVEAHRLTINFTNVTIEEIPLDSPVVFYNDNGDY